MTLVLEADVLGEDAVAKPCDAVREHQRTELTAGYHVVPYGHFPVHNFLDYALIDAFVMPADYEQVLIIFGEIHRHLLVEHGSLG